VKQHRSVFETICVYAQHVVHVTDIKVYCYGRV